MFDRAKLKASAKQQIQGNIGILVVCGLIVGLVTGLVSWVMTSIINNLLLVPAAYTLSQEGMVIFGAITSGAIQVVIQVILAAAFSIGMVMIYLNLTKGQRPQAGDVFKGFQIYGKAVALTLFTTLFTLLWSLLFLIPGIIKSIAYSMAPYILAENPGMTAREAINESKRITNGHKVDLFVLNLSFLGWILFCVVTLGIGLIYVYPYMQATIANAYLKLKGPAAETESVPCDTEEAGIS